MAPAVQRDCGEISDRVQSIVNCNGRGEFAIKFINLCYLKIFKKQSTQNKAPLASW